MRIILKSIKSAAEYRAAFERQAIDLWSLLENTTQGRRCEWRKDAQVDWDSNMLREALRCNVKQMQKYLSVIYDVHWWWSTHHSEGD